MTKRNPKRKELIKLQNSHGKKLGKALHQQSATQHKREGTLVVGFKNDQDFEIDERLNNELNRKLLESFERNKK